MPEAERTGRLMTKRLFLILACAIAVVLSLPATALGAVPPVPALSSPENGAVLDTTAPLLEWQASEGANLYDVQVGTDDTFGTLVVDQAGIFLTNFQVGDTDLGSGTLYYWHVRATNDDGTSSWSDPWSFTTSGGEPTHTPSDLQATEVWTDIVNLSWIDNCPTETGFRIERKTGDGDFELIGDRASSEAWGRTVTYSDETVSADTTYTYRVQAYSAEAESPFSNEVTVYTGVPGGAVGLEVASSAWNRTALTWTDDAFDELGFNIERRIGDSGAWVRVALVRPNLTTWNDVRCRPNTTYYYRVATALAGGLVVYSEEVPVTTPPMPPRAPLLKQPTPGARIYTLTPTLEWAAAVGAVSYTVQLSSDLRFTNILLEATTADLTLDVDAGVLGWNSRYYWRVLASNAGGNSPWRRSWFRTALGEPPVGLTATVVSATGIDLSWEDNLDNEISYRIERSSSVSGRWVAVGMVKANETAWSDTRCVSGVTYNYRIRAYGTGSFTGYSDVASATAGPDS